MIIDSSKTGITTTKTHTANTTKEEKNSAKRQNFAIATRRYNANAKKNEKKANKKNPKQDVKGSDTDKQQDIRRDLSFTIDEQNNQIFITVYNVATGEIIRKIPAEELAKLASIMHEAKGSLVNEKI